LAGSNAGLTTAFQVVRCRQGSTSIQKNLENFVVIFMSSQNQWSDIGSVVGRYIVHGFPGIGLTGLMVSFFMLKDILEL